MTRRTLQLLDPATAAVRVGLDSDEAAARPKP